MTRRPIHMEGPWTSEPDHVDFRHAGFPCIIHRNSLGALCGYVGVPAGHPWHGQDYDDIACDVHGGLTYGEPCNDEICHVPAPGEADDVYWLGFDCGHYTDVIPALEQDMIEARERLARFSVGSPAITYKDIAYVRAEVESLAEQALQAVKP